jgi:hypothetical protein
MAAEAPAERTKYKAMLRFMARDIGQTYLRSDPDAAEATLPEGWVDAMAWVMKNNTTTPTRVDRRFPNVNQANNCWCVGAARRRLAAAPHAPRSCDGPVTAVPCPPMLPPPPLQDGVQRVPALR